MPWACAALKYLHKPLLQSIASESMPRLAAQRRSEVAFSTQNIVNTAWALDLLGVLHSGGVFLHHVFAQFTELCAGSLGVEWITLAAIAEKRSVAAAVPGFMQLFHARVLDPTLAWLARVRAAEDDLALARAIRGLQAWVVELQLPHLGAIHARRALQAVGTEPVGFPGHDEGSEEAAWVAQARERVLRAAWWSCPHAAVSSQGVVAWLAADLQVPGGSKVQEPGAVHLADDSAEHSILVERMLQPIFLQVPRSGHAERRALISVLRATVRAFGSDSPKCWMDTTGTVQLYASHYLCISCLTVVAQFARRLPRVRLQVAFDDAWEAWRERPAPAGSSVAACRAHRNTEVLSVGRAA